MILEVIATNIDDIISAEKSSADRIELIENYEVGGISPSLSLVKRALKKTQKPINVMVRNNYNTFIYSDSEKQEMLNYIKLITKLNINGIVIGAITKAKEIDFEFISNVKKISNGKKITFHRAFEEVEDYKKALKQLNEINIDNILFSPWPKGKDDKFKSILTIQKHKGNIELIIGSGLNPNNYKKFIKKYFVNEIHMGSGVRIGSSMKNSLDINLINKIKKEVNF